MYYKSVNWFRGVAILFVVMGHTSLTEFAGVDVDTSFFSDGTFYFVLISGFLFYHLKERFEYFDYMNKKVKNVIIPYLFIITPGLLMAMFFYVNKLAWYNAEHIPEINNFLYYIIYLVTHGGTIIGPLWFIPMIIIFFIVSPFLKMIMESKSFGVITIISLLFTMFTLKPGVSEPLFSFIHWFGVYLLGAYLCKHYSVLNDNKYFVFIGSLFLLLLSSWLTIEYVNEPHLNKLITTFTFLSILSVFESKSININLLDVFAKYSFGVFFLHGYILQIFKRLIIPYTGPSIVVWVLAVLSCIYLTILIVKIFGVVLKSSMFKSQKWDTRLFFGV